jgi:hypothetical protein
MYRRKLDLVKLERAESSLNRLPDAGADQRGAGIRSGTVSIPVMIIWNPLDRWPVFWPPVDRRISPVTKPVASRNLTASRISPTYSASV